MLITPLVLVNSAAIYGQVRWAAEHLTGGVYATAVVFALTLESIAVYLAYEAHAALIAGDASLRLRAASYLAAGVVGALNYSHFAAAQLRPTTAAVAFGMLSAISPWLWSIRSRSVRRDQLRTAGLIDPRSAHFAAAKWVHFPLRTLRAYRWSIDHGVQEERAAWETYRHTAQSQADRRAHRKAAKKTERGAGTSRGWDQRPGRGINPKLREWVNERVRTGGKITGAVVAEHFGVSAATGRRWLQTLRGQHASDTAAAEARPE